MCVDYFFSPEKLGQFDNDDFSSDVCCAKKSIEISNEGNNFCFENEFSKYDKDGSECYLYWKMPAYCGHYDTESFSANALCCACM